MKIAVGSKNPVKVRAVQEMILCYKLFTGTEVVSVAEVVSVSVPSRVSDQPKSLGETVEGAKNRALAAFYGHDLSFGLESGLIDVPGTKTGKMDCGVCAIYDGKDFALGISSAFECPPKVTQLVNEGLDLNQAFFKAGITTNPTIGSAEGAIGLLTKGRVTRLDYIKQSILMAMIHLENAQFYK